MLVLCQFVIERGRSFLGKASTRAQKLGTGACFAYVIAE